MELTNKIESIASYMDINKMYVSGGMTKSETICQLQADIYGREILIKEDAETTAFGAFLVAMVSLGQYKTMEAAQQALNPMEDVKLYVPDPAKHAAYQEKREKMNRLYQAVRDL